MKWIVLAFLAGCLIVSLGCRSEQKLKIVTDIPANGKPVYHIEYIREF